MLANDDVLIRSRARVTNLTACGSVTSDAATPTIICLADINCDAVVNLQRLL